jgi:hypothetical protein
MSCTANLGQQQLSMSSVHPTNFDPYMTHTASALKTRGRQSVREVDIHVPVTVVVKSNHAALTVILGWPRTTLDFCIVFRLKPLFAICIGMTSISCYVNLFGNPSPSQKTVSTTSFVCFLFV